MIFSFTSEIRDLRNNNLANNLLGTFLGTFTAHEIEENNESICAHTKPFSASYTLTQGKTKPHQQHYFGHY
jgi:hypothetical protein